MTNLDDADSADLWAFWQAHHTANRSIGTLDATGATLTAIARAEHSHAQDMQELRARITHA